MDPYLTPEAAYERLGEFGYSTMPSKGDLRVASDDLDASGPFIGTKQSILQEREFPRSEHPDGGLNAEEDPPESILDWVALRSLSLSTREKTGITSESVGGASRSYAIPQATQTERRMERLLWPYQNRTPIDIR